MLSPNEPLPGEWLQVDVPYPPSVNRFVTKLGNKTPVVRRWAKQADMHFILQNSHHRIGRVAGPYEIDITFSRGHRSGDIDNRLKALIDWLEYVKIIDNDRLCERLVAAWGVAPSGCRVRVRAWV